MCSLILISIGCTRQDANTVIQDLEKSMDRLQGYQAQGTMVLHTGKNPQKYDVEVWYKEPHFYRIHLSSEGKDVTQIVLKNNEGVFVLTPELKKSFRFQSNWPENQGQVYMYQSLVKSVLQDDKRTFTTEGDHLVFQVKADYHNELLMQQRVWLHKKSMAPKRVEVIDQQQKVVIEFDYTSFDFEAKFDDHAFDKEHNLLSATFTELSTTTDLRSQESALQTQDSALQTQESALQTQDSLQQSFGIIEPAYLPSGVEKQDMTQVKLGEQQAILLRYQGTFHFNLLEHRPQAKMVLLQSAEIVDLGYTHAVLSGHTHKTFTWMSEGVEFRLTSTDLPVAEMIKIAHAMRGQSGK